MMVDHIKKLKTEYANSFNNSQINATLILSQKSGLLFPKTVLKIEEWLSKISQLDVNQDQQTLRKEILNRSKELLGITLNLFRATSNFRLMSLSFMNYIEMHLELVNQLADSNAETSTNNNTNTIVDSKDNNKVPSNAKATSFTHPICELNYYGRTTKKFSLETIDYLQFEGWSSRDYSDYKNGYNARCLIENGNDRDQVSPVAICFRRKIDAYNWDIALTPRKDQYLKFNPSLLYITELGSEETQFSMTHDFLGFINRGHNEKIEMELTDSMDRTEIQLKCKYPDVEIPKVEELFNDFSK